jgi:hypothetical protein
VRVSLPDDYRFRVVLFSLYAIAIVLGIASGALVIAYHLLQGQGVTSLDVLLSSRVAGTVRSRRHRPA